MKSSDSHLPIWYSVGQPTSIKKPDLVPDELEVKISSTDAAVDGIHCPEEIPLGKDGPECPDIAHWFYGSEKNTTLYSVSSESYSITNELNVKSPLFYPFLKNAGVSYLEFSLYTIVPYDTKET